MIAGLLFSTLPNPVALNTAIKLQDIKDESEDNKKDYVDY